MENLTNTRQKALAVNLDGSRYGTFAEIGAGQEVVRWFFLAGGASGTVAKSMSAYDMKVSDAIYGKSDRYVSRQRLLLMLDHEYRLNIERLSHLPKRLFAFADTVAARNYRGTNYSHCWMGLRFQNDPSGTPSQIVIHVEMRDKENVSQQEALGIVGVNLVHAAFNHSSNPDRLIRSLVDNLSSDRVVVDMIEVSGVAFQGIDNRVLAFHLVTNGLSQVAMFAPDGQVLQASDILYKHPVFIERGRFSPLTQTHVDILQYGRETFKKLHPDQSNEVVLMEITTKNLLEVGQADAEDFLARADVLATIGQTVILTDFAEYYELVNWLRRYTNEEIGIALGARALPELFNAKYYEKLDGRLLEGISKLFKGNVKLYVYPTQDSAGNVLTAKDFSIAEDAAHLHQYLLSQGALISIPNYEKKNLWMDSRQALQRIQSGDASWEEMVPAPVAEIIKRRKLFGYKG